MTAATLRSRTLSWALDDASEGAWNVASENDRSKKDTVPRRKAPATREPSAREPSAREIAEDLRAVVEEAEDVEARVRSRSKRMRAPSASPDEPLAGAATESITPPPPNPGDTLPSMPASRPSSGRGKESGRYSFVSPPRRDRKSDK